MTNTKNVITEHQAMVLLQAAATLLLDYHQKQHLTDEEIRLVDHIQTVAGQVLAEGIHYGAAVVDDTMADVVSIVELLEAVPKRRWS